jgi:uncharacterized SAM-binding protein YcdF (DUF218 family)
MPGRPGAVKPKRSLLARIGLLAARLASLAAAVLFIGFLVFAGMVQKRSQDDPARAEAIVVLTGGEARIPEALKLLKRGYAKRLLISGVNPATTKLELIRLNPENASLFKCCVDLDRKAINTVSNAEETARWARDAGFRSLIVVTSNYHMPRSLIELRRELPDVELVSYPVHSASMDMERWWGHPLSLRILISEYLKLFPSLIRLATHRLLPAPARDEAANAAACATPAPNAQC